MAEDRFLSPQKNLAGNIELSAKAVPKAAEIQAGDGLVLTDGTLGHSNKITAGTYNSAVISNESSGTADGGTIKMQKHSYDSEGHINSGNVDDATLTIGSGLVLNSNTLQHTNKITAGSFGTTYAANVINLAGGNYDKNGHITGVNNTNKITFTGGLKSGTTGTVEHTNSITAGTIGQSAASTGNETIAIPYAVYDANGHITGKGTHTHTINPATATTYGVIKVGTGLSMGTDGKLNHSNSVTAGSTSVSLAANKITVNGKNYDAQGHIKGNATAQNITFGSGIAMTAAGAVGHSNTAITAGTSKTLNQISFDAYGHITGYTELAKQSYTLTFTHTGTALKDSTNAGTATVYDMGKFWIVEVKISNGIYVSAAGVSEPAGWSTAFAGYLQFKPDAALKNKWAFSTYDKNAGCQDYAGTNFVFAPLQRTVSGDYCRIVLSGLQFAIAKTTTANENFRFFETWIIPKD